MLKNAVLSIINVQLIFICVGHIYLTKQEHEIFTMFQKNQ